MVTGSKPFAFPSRPHRLRPFWKSLEKYGVNVEASDVRYLQREMLFRMFVQNVSILLNATAFLVVVVVQNVIASAASGLALGFCLFSAVLAAIWCHHGARQAQIKDYLMLVQSRLTQADTWESWLPRNGYSGLLGSRWFVSTKATFIASALAASLFGWLLDNSPHAPVVAAISLVVSLCASALLLSNPKEGVAKALA